MEGRKKDGEEGSMRGVGTWKVIPPFKHSYGRKKLGFGLNFIDSVSRQMLDLVVRN